MCCGLIRIARMSHQAVAVMSSRLISFRNTEQASGIQTDMFISPCIAV